MSEAESSEIFSPKHGADGTEGKSAKDRENEIEQNSKNEESKKPRKRMNPRKKGGENMRKRPSSTSGVPIRKKQKASVESVQTEFDSKLLKTANQLSESSVEEREDKHKNFKCDKCGTPFITNPMVRGNKVKKSKLMPSPRHKLDPETKKILSLCNACGLAFNRTKKLKKVKIQPSAEEKQQYLEKAQKFANDLVKELENEQAQRFYCTYYTKTPCGCIQRFIGDGQSEDSLERARILLEITSQARDFKSMKMSVNSHDSIRNANQDETVDGNEPNRKKKLKKTTKRSMIGIGNGQKKSKPFETYVLEKRASLKKKYGFCETGTKRVLLYSNNFLHKRLKTDPEQQCRVVRQKGKFALGKLNSIEDLPKDQCCVDNCVRIAHTHKRLLEEWREKSKKGQAEARRVIAEMLTPSGGSRTNCYKFISWVTGRSLTTIGKVNEQMKKTGGNREPPEHGLKKWWKNHPKPKKDKSDTKQVPKNIAPVFSHDTTTAFVQPLGILQAAVNSSGLTTVIQNHQQQQTQQQQQQFSPAPGNNGLAGANQIIAMPQSLIAIQGGQFAIPMNTLQLQNLPIQLLQLQLLQQQQQQQTPQIAVAINSNITRQQQVTAPTMVSTNNQPNTHAIATASPNILGTMNDACVSTMLSVPPQQNPATNTTQQPVQPQYLHIAPVPTGPGSLLLQNGLTGLVSVTPQHQTGNFNLASPSNLNNATSGNLNVVVSTSTLNIPSSGNLHLISSNSLPIMPQMTSSAGADQFLSNENTMTIFNAANVNQLLNGQTLITQQTNGNTQASATPVQVSLITSG